ncbi:MAG: hypothetical protein KC620_01940 [Myxococcales bacterium]|nr:hypothetical protein [Myxococcales bacterium]
MSRIFLCLAGALLLAGCHESTSSDPEPDAGAGACTPGETRCDEEGRLRTCLEPGDAWLVERCADGDLCYEGECRTLLCEPGARECFEGGVRACALDGTSFGDATPCADDETCYDGVCLSRTCTPGERACGEGVVLTCAEDGLGWDRSPCGGANVCLDGECRQPPGGPSCEPGQVLCGPEGIFTCPPAGDGFLLTPCRDGAVCFDGRCVHCLRDRDCPDEQSCTDGECGPPALRVVTDALPPGQVGAPYAAALEARFGTPPYRWALIDGVMPRGVALNAAGELAGTPVRTGEHPLRVQVTDDAGETAIADLLLLIFPGGLSIATGELPAAEEGLPYEAQLEAVGGSPPYGWLIVGGALPAGLDLGANGRIAGTPSEIGGFDLRFRVVDASTPPQAAEAELYLEVEVAPLEITADQSFDLFGIRVVTLPTLTIIGGNPLPYDTNLTARGGLRPYSWAETDLPDNLARFIPQAGLPDGLVLAEDGHLSGIVADLSQVIEVAIPFTQINLTGFFFTAEVRDSQRVADTDSAIFLLPTLPL